MVIVKIKFIYFYIFLILFVITKLISNHKTLFYWNVYSSMCLKQNKSISFEKFEIIGNKNGNFSGDKIVIMYEKDIGLYPFLNKTNDTHYDFVNGGLPQ
uniref:Hyaluronidase n=1 Tax=Parastrongyloides trichosuri TaxID=131310 RepID=A0A0N4ZL38_PARTI